MLYRCRPSLKPRLSRFNFEVAEINSDSGIPERNSRDSSGNRMVPVAALIANGAGMGVPRLPRRSGFWFFGPGAPDPIDGQQDRTGDNRDDRPQYHGLIMSGGLAQRLASIESGEVADQRKARGAATGQGRGKSPCGITHRAGHEQKSGRGKRRRQKRGNGNGREPPAGEQF